MSLMSESTAQVAFHKFCKNFSAELFDEHVFLPKEQPLEKVMHEYDRLGFTGAVGSTDVVHIKWDCCPCSLARSYTGKEGFATIAYQATVDHSGRVLAVTKGFPGATNDKSIIRYDLAVQMVREDPMYKDRTFRLYNEDGTRTEHKGVYLLVDSGYHKWAMLMRPERFALSGEETRWSKSLDRVRKDVECFFGVLKGRFRILKFPILYREKEDIDNIFFACCILHNILHAHDGLDVLEKDADWRGCTVGTTPKLLISRRTTVGSGSGTTSAAARYKKWNRTTTC